MSKDTFYFSHDYNARVDDKVKALIRKHGMAGYGVFWAIIEDLYNNANALRSDYEGIAYDLRVDSELVKSIINDFDLFILENDSFGSISIENRLDDRNSKSEKARQSAFSRWNKIKTDANAMRTQCDSNAIKERKGNKVYKGKEIKDSKIFTPPTIEEVKQYFKESGYSEDCAINAFEYYTDLDWHDKNDNPVLNWKMKMRTVWFKDEHKIKERADFSRIDKTLKTLKK